MEYAQKPNNIPVIISAAPSDPATNSGLKLINKLNKKSDAFGIITKLDMLEKQKTNYIESMLENKTYQLGHGYCAVILRSDKDIEAGKSIEDKIKEENEILSRMPNIKPSGVLEMRKMISNMQFDKIKNEIPNLITEINAQIHSLKHSQTFFHDLLDNDQHKLSVKLRLMIEKLVGSSVERAEFEEKLKNTFKKSIDKHIIDNHFHTNDIYIPSFSSKSSVDSHILHYNGTLESSPEIYEVDGIKELFCYGLMSSVFIDNSTIADYFAREISL